MLIVFSRIFRLPLENPLESGIFQKPPGAPKRSPKTSRSGGLPLDLATLWTPQDRHSTSIPFRAPGDTGWSRDSETKIS